MEANGWHVPIKDAKYSTCTQFLIYQLEGFPLATQNYRRSTCVLLCTVSDRAPTVPGHRCSANTSLCEHSLLTPNLTFDDRQHAKGVNEVIRFLASWLLHDEHRFSLCRVCCWRIGCRLISPLYTGFNLSTQPTVKPSCSCCHPVLHTPAVTCESVPVKQPPQAERCITTFWP